jgi:hypothetical protein
MDFAELYASSALNDALPPLYRNQGLVGFNDDQKSVKPVLEVIDKAIESLR